MVWASLTIIHRNLQIPSSQNFFKKLFTRTAYVLPPSLQWTHVKMKNNLKLKLPAQSSDRWRYDLSCLHRWPRPPACRFGRPARNRSDAFIPPLCLQSNGNHSSIRFPSKNARFPSGTNPNQARKNSVPSMPQCNHSTMQRPTDPTFAPHKTLEIPVNVTKCNL